MIFFILMDYSSEKCDSIVTICLTVSAGQVEDLGLDNEACSKTCKSLIAP